MTTFRVQMAGLMIHIAKSETPTEELYTHVAILDEQTHHDEPTLVIPGANLVPRQSAPFVHKFSKYELVEFGLPNKGEADGSVEFFDSVPSLKACTNGAAIDQSIRRTERNNNILAYLIYQKGDLRVVTHFSKQGEYVFEDDGTVVIAERCVASVVEFAANDGGGNVSVTFSQINPDNSTTPFLTKIVASDSSITVTNTTEHASAKHFEHYKRLTDAGKVVRINATSGCQSAGGAAAFLNALSGGDAGVKAVLGEVYGISNEDLTAVTTGARTASGVVPLAADPDPECSNTRWP